MSRDASTASYSISCIIPTCDRPALLRHALASVLQQTLKPVEIVVVNNGRLPVSEICATHDAVRLVEAMPYFGISQARNVGAIVARGEYFAFLDDDDTWPPTYLETVSRHLGAGAQCVLTRIDKQVGSEVVPWRNPGHHITPDALFLTNPGAGGSNIVVSKRLFYEIGGYDPALITGEDKGLVVDILLAGHRVDTCLDAAIAAGQHAGPRQTDYTQMARGKHAFLRKYGKHMRWEQRLHLRMQVEWYRWKGDNDRHIVVFLRYAVLRSVYVVTFVLRRPRS